VEKSTPAMGGKVMSRARAGAREKERVRRSVGGSVGIMVLGSFGL